MGTPQLFFGFVYTLYKYQVKVEEHATTDGRTLSGDYLSYLDCSAMVHFKKEALRILVQPIVNFAWESFRARPQLYLISEL